MVSRKIKVSGYSRRVSSKPKTRTTRRTVMRKSPVKTSKCKKGFHGKLASNAVRNWKNMVL